MVRKKRNTSYPGPAHKVGKRSNQTAKLVRKTKSTCSILENDTNTNTYIFHF